MLCLCDIVSGGQKPNSWRLHLEGAAAVFASSDTYSDQGGKESSRRTFLRRWWRSLEVITLLCGKPTLSLGSRLALLVAQSDGYDYIDEFDGLSIRLIPIFAEINLLR